VKVPAVVGTHARDEVFDEEQPGGSPVYLYVRPPVPPEAVTDRGVETPVSVGLGEAVNEEMEGFAFTVRETVVVMV
jgi:hypothetical protein